MRIIYLFHLITSLAWLESWGTIFGIAPLANGFDSGAKAMRIRVRHRAVTSLDTLRISRKGCDHVITVVLAAGDDLLGFSSAELGSSH